MATVAPSEAPRTNTAPTTPNTSAREQYILGRTKNTRGEALAATTEAVKTRNGEFRLFRDLGLVRRFAETGEVSFKSKRVSRVMRENNLSVATVGLAQAVISGKDLESAIQEARVASTAEERQIRALAESGVPTEQKYASLSGPEGTVDTPLGRQIKGLIDRQQQGRVLNTTELATELTRLANDPNYANENGANVLRSVGRGELRQIAHDLHELAVNVAKGNANLANIDLALSNMTSGDKLLENLAKTQDIYAVAKYIRLVAAGAAAVGLITNPFTAIPAVGALAITFGISWWTKHRQNAIQRQIYQRNIARQPNAVAEVKSKREKKKTKSQKVAAGIGKIFGGMDVESDAYNYTRASSDILLHGGDGVKGVDNFIAEANEMQAEDVIAALDLMAGIDKRIDLSLSQNVQMIDYGSGTRAAFIGEWVAKRGELRAAIDSARQRLGLSQQTFESAYDEAATRANDVLLTDQQAKDRAFAVRNMVSATQNAAVTSAISFVAGGISHIGFHHESFDQYMFGQHGTGVASADSAHSATGGSGSEATTQAVNADAHAANGVTSTNTTMQSSGVINPNDISRVSAMQELHGTPYIPPEQWKVFQQALSDNPHVGGGVDSLKAALDEAYKNGQGGHGSVSEDALKHILEKLSHGDNPPTGDGLAKELQQAASHSTGDVKGLTPDQIMKLLHDHHVVPTMHDEAAQAGTRFANEHNTSTDVLSRAGMHNEAAQAGARFANEQHTSTDVLAKVPATDQQPSMPDVHNGGSVDYGQTAEDLSQLKGITPPSGDSFVFDAAHHSINLVDAQGNVLAADVHVDPSSHNLDMIMANGQHVEISYVPGAEGTLDQFVQPNRIEFSGDTRNWQDLHAYVKGDGIVFKYEPHIMPNGVQAIGFMDHTGHAFYIPNDTLVNNDPNHWIPLINSHGQQIGQIRSSDLYHELGLNPHKVAEFARISQARVDQYGIGTGHTQFAVDNYPKYFPGQSLISMRAIGGSWDHNTFIAGASNHSFSGDFDLQNTHVGGGYDFEHPIIPGSGEDDFQTAFGRFFDEHIGSDDLARLADQAALFAQNNPGAAAALAVGGLAIHRGLNARWGIIGGNNRTSNIMHGIGVPAITVGLALMNPGAAAIFATAYVLPYIPRGAVGFVRAITGRGGNTPTPPGGGTPPTPPGGGTPPGAGTPAATATPAATNPGGGTNPPPGAPAPRPANAYPNFAGSPLAQAAHNLGNPAIGTTGRRYNQAVNNMANQLMPNNPGIDHPAMEQQVRDAAQAARDAYNANHTLLPGNRVSVHMEDAAAALVEGNPLTGLDLTNQMNARAMAEVMLPNFSESNLNYTADAIRRAAIARQEFEAIPVAQRNNRADLQAAATRALGRINAEVDNTLDPAARARGVAMQAIAARNMFMHRGHPGSWPLVEGALNSAFASQTGMTPELNAVAAAAVHPTHMQYTQAQFNALPYDDPHAPIDQRRIYEARVEAAMRASRLRFGASPSPADRINNVLRTLNETYQDIPYLGTSEDQRLRAMDEAIRARGGTFEQRIQAVVAMSPDEISRATRSAELITLGNNQEMFAVARVLNNEGLSGDIIRQAIEDSLANRGYHVNPVGSATIEALLDPSTTADEKMAAGIRFLTADARFTAFTPALRAAAISETVDYMRTAFETPGTPITFDQIQALFRAPELNSLSSAERAHIIVDFYNACIARGQRPAESARYALSGSGLPDYATTAYNDNQIETYYMAVQSLNPAAIPSTAGLDIAEIAINEFGLNAAARGAIATRYLATHLTSPVAWGAALQDSLGGVVTDATSAQDLASITQTMASGVAGEANWVASAGFRTAAALNATCTGVGFGPDARTERAVVLGSFSTSTIPDIVTEFAITPAVAGTNPGYVAQVARGLLLSRPADANDIHSAFRRNAVVNEGNRVNVARAAYDMLSGTDQIAALDLALAASGVSVGRASQIANMLRTRRASNDNIRNAMQRVDFTQADRQTIAAGVIRSAGIARGTGKGAINRALADALVASGCPDRLGGKDRKAFVAAILAATGLVPGDNTKFDSALNNLESDLK